MNLSTWSRSRAGLLVHALISIGCVGSSAPVPSTGAQEVAQEFCESILQRNWSRAYTALDTRARAQCTAEQFDSLASRYRIGVGFEPEGVFVRSCEEHGDQALAHVVFTGPTATGQKFYKDVVTLRRSEAIWGVVLPARFGRARPH